MWYSTWLMPLREQSKSKPRFQLWIQQVLAQLRKETQRSQYLPEVAQPEVVVLEEGASAGVTEAAVVVVVKANKKAKRVFQMVHARSTEGTEERHITAWI